MNEKYEKLTGLIKELGRVIIAYSGGIDSTFLLAAATESLGSNAMGVIIDFPGMPRHEINEAVKMALTLGASHTIIEMKTIPCKVRKNDVDRCYHCKKNMYATLLREASKWHASAVLDGSNADDRYDYRPGMAALRELKIMSPLLDLGFTKNEIRELSRYMGIATWNKPAYACLYSRIPYDRRIKTGDLWKVEQAENVLLKKGFNIVRVRCYDDIARIEVETDKVALLLTEPLKSEIAASLKKYGFTGITIDPEGYRPGKSAPPAYRSINLNTDKQVD